MYSSSGVTYPQLMVAAHKAENGNEETKDRVRAKAAVTTKLVEVVAKLKQQIAQLMAPLTQGGWGSGKTSPPSSLQEHGYGCRPSGGSKDSQPNS